MEPTIQFNIYLKYPNVKKMIEQNYSSIDFIAYSFEFIIITPILNKNSFLHSSLQATVALLLDVYQNEPNISFDIAQPEDLISITNKAYNFKTHQNKLKATTVKIDSEDITLLLDSSYPFNIHKSIQENINQLISEHLQINNSNIIKFLADEKINYEKKELINHLKEFTTLIEKDFTEHNFFQESKNNNAFKNILNHNLNNTLKTNEQSSPKLKI